MNENEKMIMQISKDVAVMMSILNGDFKTMKDDIKYIQAEVKQQSEKTAEITALRDRILKLESTNTWVIRTIIAVIISSVMGIAMIIK